MYTGVFDTIGSIVSSFGISLDSATAVAQAYAAPTIVNINNVTAAFAAEGATPPPELMQSLWERYYSSIAQNPLAATGQITTFLSNPMVWLIGGGILIFVFSRKKR